MLREHVEKFLPIIKAFGEGKAIECLNYDGSWAVMNFNPVFDGKPENYRIKPEVVTGWVNVYDKSTRGYCLGGFYFSKEEADAQADQGRVACTQVTVTLGEGL